MPIRPGCYGHKPGKGKMESGFNLKFADAFQKLSSVPASVDLRKWISEPYDQLQTSSCVLNAWASLIEYGQRRSGGPDWTPSRLFAYWNARDLEDDTGQDGGSYIHDAFHQGSFVGIIPETDYPFDPAMLLSKPPKECFDKALNDRIHFFASLDNSDLHGLKSCIAHGFPFEFGFQVPAIFETDEFEKNPVLKLPASHFVGGHGVAAFGYDDAKNAFLIRNSWGADWAEEGYFWMDYDFITSGLCTDFWMVRFLGQQTSVT